VDLPAVGLAGAAAVVFAVANNFQRHAASRVPEAAGGPFTLLLRLARTPRWLIGSSLAMAALALHAVALARGGVTAVQSILAAGLVAALALEAVRERRRMRRPEALGAVILVTAVALLLAWGRPGGGRDIALTVQAGTAVILAGVVAVGLAASRLRRSSHASALVMAAAGGAGFALDAVYLKGVANWADDLDALPALTSAAGFVVASILSNVLVQRAYQRAPLRVALPAVTAADPLVAFVVGRLLLGERLEGGPYADLGVVLGLLGIAVGVVLTVRSSAPGSATPQV
jgi:hypothetical protein